MNYRGLVVILLLCGYMGALCAEDLAPYAGTYSGQVMSSGALIPIVTTLSIKKSGKITGSYVMEEGEDEGDSSVTGKLTFDTQESPWVLLFRWEDKYGSGYLRVLFATDYHEFSGFWGDSTKDTCVELWTGKRQED